MSTCHAPRVIEHLRAHPGATAREIGAALGIKPYNLVRTLDVMEIAGQIVGREHEPDGGGRTTRVYRLSARLAGAPKRRTRITRPCLCCRRDFESEGAHNRLCQHCRRLSPSPYAP